MIENKASIEITRLDHRQYFGYYVWGFVDTGIFYDFFYSSYDEYNNQMKDYRNGYLKYGTPYSGVDWCYI